VTINLLPRTDSFPWFALQIRSRYEKIAATLLCGKGYELFLPVYKSRRRWSDRIKELEVPLFPGYLFCRFNPLDRLPILVTPGVIQVVGIGKSPVPVDDAEIAAIQTAVQSGLPRQPWPFLQIGQRVRVECGPLCGLEGILVDFKGRHRLVLSVTLLQRSVAVEVDGAWVISIPQQHRAYTGPASFQHTNPPIRKTAEEAITKNLRTALTI
jgi:transcription antitermination factor NusG